MVKQNEMLIGIVIVAALLLATGTINFGGAGAIAPGGAAPGAGIAGCTLSTSQTISNASYNADKPGTATTGGYPTYFVNPATGELNAGGATTVPGGTYTMFERATSYFSTVKTVTTGCVASVPVSVLQKAVDTAVSLTAYENNGITALAVGTENLTIGASGSATAHIKMAQSAAFTHLSGDSGKFAVFINVTAGTQNNYSVSQMSAVFDGVPCVAYTSAGLSNAATPAVLTGVYLTGWVCTGDFAANDGSIHELAVRYAAASGINPNAGAGTNIGIVGIDRYIDGTTGVLSLGAVSETGAAIQTLQTVSVNVD